MARLSPNILLVIPARYASTRFPGKPLADIAGKPMIQRVWERTQMSALGTRTVVATDDTRIADAVAAFGGEAVMTDPNLSTGTERMAAVAKQVEADIYVNVQGDEPLISPDTIDAAIDPLLHNLAVDIGTAAATITDAADLMNPNVVKVVTDLRGRALYFSRSTIPFVRDPQQPGSHPHELFRRHIGIYAFRAAALHAFAVSPISPLEAAEKLEQLRALQYGLYIHVAPTESVSIAVDVPSDIDAVLSYMQEHGISE